MERFTLKLRARLFVLGEDRDQETIELLTSNICAGGAFFGIPHFFSVGTRVHMHVLFPEHRISKLKGKKAAIKVIGTIIRSDEKGYAISFDEDYQILPLEG